MGSKLALTALNRFDVLDVLILGGLLWTVLVDFTIMQWKESTSKPSEKCKSMEKQNKTKKQKAN